ncbi:hypothetical protein [Actinoplanes sp. NPDC049681]|uniref:hypothetical protein n=1 Tax=Actinoplanes sp. NPDC049681 TaxID=3363905 RepID=UPI0037A4CF6F
MRSWVTDLLAAWRGEHIALSSPMPVEVARRWLSGDSASEAGDVIRRSAAKLNTRSTWRPVLRGQLLPSDSGSTFVGVLGWDPALKVLTCCLFGAFAGVFLVGATVAAASAAYRGWHAVGLGLALAGFGLFGVLTSLASTLIGYRETRGQADYLRSWITGQLNAPWYRARGSSDD